MALQKSPIDIAFAQGLDQKIDPFRLPIGKFQALTNSVFDKGGVLTKRNGYGYLASLPNTSSNYLTTLNDNLTAVGPTISAYNAGNKAWVSKGNITPLAIDTLPIIKNNLNQTQCDSAIASNGLVCTVYSELNNATTVIKYVVSDSVTGQNIVAPTAIPVTTSGSTPRVFILGSYFIIVFTNLSSTYHLAYIAVNITNPSIVSTQVNIDASYIPASTVSWDARVSNNTLYIAWNTTTGGQAIKMRYLTAQLALSAVKTYAGQIATMMSIATDDTVPQSPVIYVSYYDSASKAAYYFVVDSFLAPVLSPTLILNNSNVYANMTSIAQSGQCEFYFEDQVNYNSPVSTPANFIVSWTMTQAGASVSGPVAIVNTVGLASKAFRMNGTTYFLTAHQSTYQPTYFLINATLSVATAPVIVARLAYENGGGYCTLGLPSVTVSNDKAYISYLRKDLVQALSVLGNPQQSTAGGIYSQTGINLATFEFTSSSISTTEIGSGLHLSGGFLGLYDGYLPAEHNFFLWPEDVKVTTSTSGGSLKDQKYFYVATYEWSDNQGNIYRSAPSIPFSITTSGGNTSTNTVYVPMLALTMKIANPPKIVIYRWSTDNQIYYQITSITAPKLNDPNSTPLVFTDTVADASIIGNNILYTTGGVIEDMGGPACNIMALFDTRLWLVDAEDQNLLWFSKQVIESTPVEMSDLLTVYVAPNAGTAASTGPITGLAPMDDKLIIFKKDALYYINGAGPDNTGSNNQYSQPIFIAGTVGCTNQRSIVLTPMGLMFQSDKGIWLLGRDLQTSYIGAPVSNFNTSTVNSANNIPQTNQVRFTLSTGETLVYDTYYQQWGTFKNVPATSSCVYQGLHTYINSYGAAYQETPGAYLDGSAPVLLSFTTSWINVAGIHGFERAYYFYLLGTYLSPHKLQLQIAYDYNGSPSQSLIITPSNFSSAVPSPYGSTPAPFGSPVSLEQWRIFLDRQKCQAFQITLNELFDPSLGVVAGAGVALSGLNLIVSAKKGYKPLKAAHSAGGNS